MNEAKDPPEKTSDKDVSAGQGKTPEKTSDNDKTVSVGQDDSSKR